MKKKKSAQISKSEMFYSPWEKRDSDDFNQLLLDIYASKLCSPLSVYQIKDVFAENIGVDIPDLDYCSIDVREASVVRQILSLFKKNSDYRNADARSRAYERFKKSERRCMINNYKLFKLLDGSAKVADPFVSLLFVAQRKFQEILGECPCLSDLHLQFGPGASCSVKRKTTARYKFQSVPTVAFNSSQDLDSLWETMPTYQYLHKGVAVKSHGSLSFVPKTSDIDRSILVDTTLNMMPQKGIGRHIRQRLSLFGIDLKNGQQVNRNRARIGSITGYYSTIDLADASNSIYSVLVSNLASTDWFALLDTWRTHTFVYKGDSETADGKYLNMFSSMGNGFTFELESLIFYVICWAAMEMNKSPDRDITIYGDDIIIPTRDYEVVTAALQRAGFTVNLTKSFSSGPFRESCGGDYLRGTDIRPFYVKGRWSYARIVGLLNHDSANSNLLTTEERSFLIEKIPAVIRLFGPYGLGDGHIHSEMYEYVPFHPERGFADVLVTTLVQRAKRQREYLNIGDDLYAQYSIYSKADTIEIFENCVLYRKFRLRISQLDEWLMECLHLKGLALSHIDPYVLRGKSYEQRFIKVQTRKPILYGM